MASNGNSAGSDAKYPWIVRRTPLQTSTLAARLAASAASIRFVREVANAALDVPLAKQLTAEATYQTASGRTQDFVEGVTAFRERRRPMFNNS